MHLMSKTAYVWGIAVASRHKVMADKGFKNLAEVLPRGNTVIIPHFKSRGMVDGSFSEAQVDHNRGIAKSRWVVEAHFSRVAEFAVVEDEIAYCDFHMANSAWFLANGLALVRAPFKQPAGNVEFASLGAAWAWARASSRVQT